MQEEFIALSKEWSGKFSWVVSQACHLRWVSALQLLGRVPSHSPCAPSTNTHQPWSRLDRRLPRRYSSHSKQAPSYSFSFTRFTTTTQPMARVLCSVLSFSTRRTIELFILSQCCSSSVWTTWKWSYFDWIFVLCVKSVCPWCKLVCWTRGIQRIVGDTQIVRFNSELFWEFWLCESCCKILIILY